MSTIRGLESGRIRHPRRPSIRRLADALALSEADNALLAAAARREPRECNARQSSIGAPAYLPPMVAGFAGRTDELKALDKMLLTDPDGLLAPSWSQPSAGLLE